MRFLKICSNNKRQKLSLWSYQAILLICLASMLTACEPGGTGMDDKEVIASYGEIPLYREEMDYFLPRWENPADSARLAQIFIEDWMKAQAIAERASNEIGDLEEEVSYKRNDFERRLIEFKFAQYLIATQLDTVISEQEIRNYYLKQPDKFISQAVYYSHFFVKTEVNNPSREVSWMRSDTREQIDALAEWSQKEAVEFKLDSSFVTQTAISSVLEGSRLNISYLRLNNVYTFTQREEDQNYFVMFKLLEEVKEGELMPLGMCREIIRDILLNQRKNRLVQATETDLLKNAKASGKVKIVGAAE